MKQFYPRNNREGDNNFAEKRKANPRRPRNGHQFLKGKATQRYGTRLWCAVHEAMQAVTKSDGFEIRLDCDCVRKAVI